MGAVAFQIMIAFFISTLIFMGAFGNVWPSYALKIFQSDHSPLGYKITQSDGNLIGSITMLGSLSSILIVGYINEKVGRKRSEILAALCMMLGWSIIATAKSITQLVIGRYLTGFGTGMQIITSLIFLAEISQPSIRGMNITVTGFMYNFGTLVSYLEGWFFSYDVINYLCLITLVIFVIIAMFLKETPSYLMKNGKQKEALNSLKFYRGASTITQEILEELVYIRSQQKTSDNDYKSGLNTKLVEIEKLREEKDSEELHLMKQKNPWKIFFSSKSSQRAILLLSLHIILAVLMGMIGVQAYAGQLFRRAVPDISPDMCSVILAIVVSVTSAVVIVITDRFPRRVLMIFSCTTSAVCMALLASMLRWCWAPELCIPLMIILYSIFFQIGAITVPIVQIPECISSEMKSFGSTFVISAMILANFIVLYLFEPCVTVFGLDGIFFIFSFMGFLTAGVTYFFMRETRNVPFEIIEDTYERGYLNPRSENR